MLLLAGLIVLVAALFPYLIYLCGIFFGKKSSVSPVPATYPPISIVMSAYNEERIIEDRIENIRASRYPKDSIEIVLIDDCSSDGTLARARSSLERSGIQFQIIANTERMGTNRSFNNGMKNARHTVVVITGADVFFEPDALNLAIDRLMSGPDVAAVTGELLPMMNANSTTKLEHAYRSVYGSMCDWESAVDSTYNFNGGLVALRTDMVRRINDKRGADDANTAFEAIRKGYRALYERRAIVYEDIPESFRVQYRQKIRRATRIIEATLSNLDLLKNDRPFSRFFYPLRIFMYLCSPTLFFVSLVLLAAGIFFVSPVLLAGIVILLLLLSLIWKNNLFIAFTVNQFYLVRGLLNLGKDMRVWESSSKKGDT